MVTRAVLRGDRDVLARRPYDGTVGETPQPDLGPLQVREDADHAATLGGDLPDHAVQRRVLGVGAVAEVQPGDIHSGVDEFGQYRRRGRGRAQRADDLCAAIRHFLLLIEEPA